ncbi:MAG: hypothetical protein GEV11_10600, partial [Streptosporangiales bacterium]|nr:hypothetical protein [Streptosporangiales bacterium]
MAVREPARFEYRTGHPPGGPRTPLIQRLAWWAQRYPDSPAFTFVDHATPAIAPDDLACLQYTSGSTRSPSG